MPKLTPFSNHERHNITTRCTESIPLQATSGREFAGADNLRESELRFCQLAENIREVFFLMEPSNTSICYVSPAYEEVFGRSCASLYADPQSWAHAIHPDDAAAALDRMAPNGTIGAFDVEYRIVRPDGEVRSVRSRGFPVRDETGEVRRIVGIAQDITDEADPRGGLRESEAGLRRAQTLAKLAHAITRHDGSFEAWSHSLPQLLGIAPAQMPESARDLLKLLHPDDRRTARSAAIAAGASGENAALDYRLRRHGGEWIRIHQEMELLSGRADSNGKPRWFSTLQDVTAQESAEQASRESERRFADMLNNVKLVSVMLDRAACVTYANDHLLALTGRRRDEVLGRNWFELFVPTGVASTAFAVAFDGPRHHVNEIVTRAGKRLLIQWNNTVLRSTSGEVIGAASIGEDITGRAAAEASLREPTARCRRLFEANPHPMWKHDPVTLRFLAVNDAAVAHYGYRRDEWQSMTLDDVRVHRGPKRCAQGGVPSQQQHRLKDGRLIEVEVATQPVDFQGRPACLVLAQDVTEQRRDARQVLESREALRALVRRLQHAQEEERTRVSREIHDELGQLLTGLTMDLRWLERKLSEPGLPPQLNTLLDRIVAASDLNAQTITTVQKLAAELRPAALDQLGLAAALAQRARQFQQRTGVACTVHWSETVPELAPAVATELFYICQEALTNVTRHAQATRVHIRIIAEDAGVCMEVEDNGVGVDPKALTAPRSLGLLGMRERAAHCGGNLILEAGAQSGTRVVIRIPLAMRTEATP